MNVAALIMVGFAVLGAADRLIGNRFGIGREFERGFEMLGILALSMLGMIVISPFLAQLMQPGLTWLTQYLPFDPSIFTASIFANDMGGAALSDQVSVDQELGLFNGLVVGSMMGCTVSFTVPFALSAVKKEKHRQVLLGLLCGIITIPVGCFAGGITAGIPVLKLLLNLLPLLLFSLLVALGLWKAPNLCVKLFRWLGIFIKGLITVGLAIGIVHMLTGYTPIQNITPLAEGGQIVLSAAAVMSGAFPLIAILSKLLQKPLEWVGKKAKINQVSVMGFLTSMATSAPMFGKTDEMDDRGIILNSAFAVSAAFLLTDHLAFTLAYNANYLWSMMIGKTVAGALGIAVAYVIGKREIKKS